MKWKGKKWKKLSVTSWDRIRENRVLNGRKLFPNKRPLMRLIVPFCGVEK